MLYNQIDDHEWASYNEYRNLDLVMLLDMDSHFVRRRNDIVIVMNQLNYTPSSTNRVHNMYSPRQTSVTSLREVPLSKDFFNSMINHDISPTVSMLKWNMVVI